MAHVLSEGFEAYDVATDKKLETFKWPKRIVLPAPENMRHDGTYIVQVKGGTMQMVVKLESNVSPMRFYVDAAPGIIAVGAAPKEG